ncbi:MAG: mechanosensitive ion channel family protein [Candidatus Krumholzibacteria bacterium]|nr:mechanosensitive ion channel family protein [Candidatus Krumholzibacteria bacterium]
MEGYTDIIVQWLLGSGIRIVAIIVGSFIVIRIFRILIRRSKDKLGPPEKMGVERAKRTETLASILENTARVLVLIAAFLMVIKEAGINIGPLLAGAGVVGLAIGFGAQSLVKDVIRGFFILLENHMNVGDVVKVAGVAGLVESINLRVTVLRDLEGKVHIIPNGEISVVTNMTREWARAVIEIGVAYKEDIDKVIEVLEKVGDEFVNDEKFAPMILEPFQVLGLDSFGDSSVNIKAIVKTQPIQQWTVARELRRRIKKAFDAKGIEIPFPHVTLYVGEAENRGRLKVDVKSQD